MMALFEEWSLHQENISEAEGEQDRQECHEALAQAAYWVFFGVFPHRDTAHAHLVLLAHTPNSGPDLRRLADALGEYRNKLLKQAEDLEEA